MFQYRWEKKIVSYDSLVPALTYGSESWIVSYYVKTVEIWFYRPTMCTPWTYKTCTGDMLKESSSYGKLVTCMRRCSFTFFEHVMRTWWFQRDERQEDTKNEDVRQFGFRGWKKACVKINNSTRHRISGINTAAGEMWSGLFFFFFYKRCF